MEARHNLDVLVQTVFQKILIDQFAYVSLIQGIQIYDNTMIIIFRKQQIFFVVLISYNHIKLRKLNLQTSEARL